jgi:outer membrane protein assembly factor BamB
VTSEDGNLYALNQQGILLWKFQTGSPVRTTPAIGSDGTIYLASYITPSPGNPEGILYAISPSGKVKWNLTLVNFQGYDSLSSPTMGPDGTIYTSDIGFRIIAVNPGGTLKWQLTTGGEVFDSPTVGQDGTLYVGIDDDNPSPSALCGQCLVALNPDGTLKWSLGPHFSPSFIAVGADGTIYAGGTAINPDGTVKWRFFAEGIDSIGPGGTIYLSGDGLNAVNPEGTLKWQFAIDNGTSSCTSTGCSYVFVQQSSAAIGSNGIIYFGRGVTNLPSGQAGNGTGSVYAVGPNGTLVWKLGVGSVAGICGPGFCERVFSVSDPAIGSNGTIYIGSGDGNLYAIG